MLLTILFFAFVRHFFAKSLIRKPVGCAESIIRLQISHTSHIIEGIFLQKIADQHNEAYMFFIYFVDSGAAGVRNYSTEFRRYGSRSGGTIRKDVIFLFLSNS